MDASLAPARTPSRIGAAAAGGSALLALAYDVAQLAEWRGALGSTGGPAAVSTPLGLVVLLVPSLLLGPAFMVVAAAFAARAAETRKAAGLAGLAAATAYATLTGSVYYIQLAYVLPRLSTTSPSVEPFRFVPFASALYAVDLLGYGFMSLACGLIASSLAARRETRRLRLALWATACLAPFILLQTLWQPLLWIAAAWAVTFPLAMLFAWAELGAARRRDR